MIVVDLSQICIAAFMQATKQSFDNSADMEWFRHVVLNSLRAINMKFRSHEDYDRMIVAADRPNSWRKKVFPYYKAHRKDDKQKSAIDWSQLYSCVATIQTELVEYFPFQLVAINHAEADDVIASIARMNSEANKYTLIVSGDKDFVQLQRTALVRQYDNVNDRPIAHDNPSRYLFEHIMKGDRGDGIPNVLSPDDSFVNKIRQKPMRQQMMDSMWENGIDKDVINPEYLKRNRMLIDLSQVPDPIYKQVTEQVTNYQSRRTDLYKYFVQYQLKELAGRIGDFR